MRFFQLLSPRQIQTLQGHQNPVISVSISPDGQTLASGSWDKTVKLWNVKTGELTRTLQGHQDSVWSVSFSPDGQTLASGGEDGTVKLWPIDFDLLMEHNCDWVRPYLLHNPTVKKEDRHLCGTGKESKNRT